MTPRALTRAYDRKHKASMATDLPIQLTQTAVDRYHDQGYHVQHGPLLPEPRFERLGEIFEEHLASRGDRRADELDVPHFHDERLLDFLLDACVLDVVEDVIGPDIGLWSSHFISKEPGIGRASPWHTDADYWNGRFDRFTGIVTVWLAIDKVDQGNGCMRVIPGSHRDVHGEYAPVDRTANTFGTELSEVAESMAVYFELEPNQYSLHDSRLIHGALANTSDRRRTGYTMRYFSQHMRLNRDHPGNQQHKMWHGRGRNVVGNPVVN